MCEKYFENRLSLTSPPTSLVRCTRRRRHLRLWDYQIPTKWRQGSKEGFKLRCLTSKKGAEDLTTKPKPFLRLMSLMRPNPRKNRSTSFSFAW